MSTYQRPTAILTIIATIILAIIMISSTNTGTAQADTITDWTTDTATDHPATDTGPYSCYAGIDGIQLSDYSIDGYCTFGAPLDSTYEQRPAGHYIHRNGIVGEDEPQFDCRIDGNQVCGPGFITETGILVTPGNYAA